MAGDWRSTFRDRLVSPDVAALQVQDGDLVRLPMGPVPATLLTALARRRHTLRGVRLLQGATRHAHPWASGDPGYTEHVQFVTDFVSAYIRQGMDSRHTDFAVTDYSVAARVVEAGRRDGWTPDVFMALVSEPDADGYVNFGFSLWHSRSLLQAAKRAIAEVGRAGTVLRPRGDTRVHLSAFDLLVEQTESPATFAAPELSPERVEVTEVVGAYVSTLVRDGDTIQIGTGTLSSCMGAYCRGAPTVLALSFPPLDQIASSTAENSSPSDRCLAPGAACI